jgi:hypothetical protein
MYNSGMLKTQKKGKNTMMMTMMSQISKGENKSDFNNENGQCFVPDVHDR